MADEPSEAGPIGESKGRGGLITALVIGAIMIVEGVGVYVLTNYLSASPSAAVAGEAASDEGGTAAVTGEMPGAGQAEVALANCRLTSRTGAKAYTISVRLSGIVRTEDRQRAETLIERMRSRIDDRVNFVLRSASQKLLNEPGLETIKRQLKHEFDKILGADDFLLEVLVPELLQTGSGV